MSFFRVLFLLSFISHCIKLDFKLFYFFSSHRFHHEAPAWSLFCTEFTVTRQSWTWSWNKNVTNEITKKYLDQSRYFFRILRAHLIKLNSNLQFKVVEIWGKNVFTDNAKQKWKTINQNPTTRDFICERFVDLHFNDFPSFNDEIKMTCFGNFTFYLLLRKLRLLLLTVHLFFVLDDTGKWKRMKWIHSFE